MIVARHDLERLFRRAAVRLVLGAILTFLLAGQALSDFEARQAFFEPAILGLGLGVGLLAVVHGRWRVEQTLLETRLAADLPLFALPALMAILLVQPVGTPIAMLAVAVCVARALVLAQEAAIFSHTRQALQPSAGEPALALPIIWPRSRGKPLRPQPTDPSASGRAMKFKRGVLGGPESRLGRRGPPSANPNPKPSAWILSERTGRPPWPS